MAGNNTKSFGESSDEVSAMFGRRTNGFSVNYEDAEAKYNVDGVIDDIRFFSTKLSTVDVILSNGAFLQNVVWPGGYIDPETMELHGDWIPPVRGQKVVVSFVGGDIRDAYISSFQFRAALSDEVANYVDFKTEKGLSEDSIYRSHRSGGRQHFYDNTIETGFVDKAGQKITPDAIETGFEDGAKQIHTKDTLVSGIAAGGTIGDSGKISQSDSGVELGAGGPSGYKPVAVVGDNYVLTLLGLQPILSGPTRVGPFEQKVKA